MELTPGNMKYTIEIENGVAIIINWDKRSDNNKTNILLTKETKNLERALKEVLGAVEISNIEL